MGASLLQRSSQTSATTAANGDPRPLSLRLAAPVEVIGIFAACQLFLWKYSQVYRRGWLLILLFLLASLLLRRPSAAKLGISFCHGWGALRWMVPGVVLPVAPLLIYGAREGRIGLLRPDLLAVMQFLTYLGWCALQQFALQSYLHNRLLDAVPNRHLTSAMTAVMFGSLHLPNPVLTVATLAGGVLLGEIFTRHRNIWVLALGQALVSTVILVSLPDAWHHRLRVGPGYDWWEVPRPHQLPGFRFRVPG